MEPHLSLNKIGHALHETNEVYRKITLDERVKEACFQLDFKDPAVVQSMYIFKNPELGGEGTCKQIDNSVSVVLIGLKPKNVWQMHMHFYLC